MPRPERGERASSGAAPLDPCDVEDMRLRIEAHKLRSEEEAASARSFRLASEKNHDELLLVISELERARRERHASFLETMVGTYARARDARLPVTPQGLALRRRARSIGRAMEAAGADENSGDGNRWQQQSPKKASRKNNADEDAFAIAALEAAADDVARNTLETYQHKITQHARSRIVSLNEKHLTETSAFVKKITEEEKTFLQKKSGFAAERFRGDKSAAGAKNKDAVVTKKRHEALVTAVSNAATTSTNAVARFAKRLARESDEARLVQLKQSRLFPRKLKQTIGALPGDDGKQALWKRVEMFFLDDDGLIDWQRVETVCPFDSSNNSERVRRTELTARAEFKRRRGDEKKEIAPLLCADGNDTSIHKSTDTESTDAETTKSTDTDSDDMPPKWLHGSFSNQPPAPVRSFPSPSNRNRRLIPRAKLGSAQVAALGTRRCDGKGFGVLGESKTSFVGAGKGPGGRGGGEDVRYDDETYDTESGEVTLSSYHGSGGDDDEAKGELVSTRTAASTAFAECVV